jgi:hypothetical protein
MCCVWLIHPYIIKLNHKGRANANVKVKWLELVNTYGNNPRKLLNKIRENNEINIKELPGCPVGPKSVLNSLCKVKRILFQTNEYRDGINQKAVGINVSPKIVLIQFKERFITLVEGSKTENRFVIIFNL